jgi:predicted AAA+ superfamily ATPase
MLQVSEKEVETRLTLENTWWDEGAVDPRFEKLPRRDYFQPFFDLIRESEASRAVVLMGPRRVGKTVLIHHVISAMMENGVSEADILYVSIEAPVFTGLSLEKMLTLFRTKFEHARKAGLYVFFDEIQYLKNWEVHLKDLVDTYPSIQFVASGSAAAALRLKSQESGAGRFTDFMLPPLTFAEYLRFVEKDEALVDTIMTDDGFDYLCENVDELNTEFVNYLNFGGYPEAVFNKTIREDTARFIRSDIIDKVLLRDLPSLYGIQDIQELNKLFTSVAYNTAQEVNLEQLSQSAGISKVTIKRYLEYLEAAFLVKRITRVDQSCKQFKRERFFKVYLTNPSMRAALFGNVEADSDSLGALAETAIYSQWLHSENIRNICYARWKRGEIDIVYQDLKSQNPLWAVEVKWSDRMANKPSELSEAIVFLQKNGLGRLSVTTKTKSKQIVLDGVEIEFSPTSLYAYTVGKNLTRPLSDYFDTQGSA